jgi:hypothetical protein
MEILSIIFTRLWCKEMNQKEFCTNIWKFEPTKELNQGEELREA